ncbi:MAG: hypothetical protein KAG34_01230 [Cocleimonas sp.]|nr:hypothetical protein [Sulfurovaceae bacterium]MCK5917016.1 hypothetical protein [Cocleimonas sp.]
MRTILHIGQHKTGTTSLQHYLQQQRQHLSKKGLYVPDAIVGIKHPSHYILNVYSLESKRLSPMKEVLIKNKNPDYFQHLEERLISDIEKHYQRANKQQCNDIIWSNEGLYLLNSVTEYKKLRQLFEQHSDEIVCICCFREKKSFRQSYMQQLKTQELLFSHEEDSYCNIDPTSWLFDYDRKKDILQQVFSKNLTIPYDPEDMVRTFMTSIGYDSAAMETEHLNITSYE